MKKSAILLAACAFAAASSVHALEQGDWIWRAGVHTVQPKSDNHRVVNVDSAAMITFNGSYLFTSNLALEVLAALPFTHDVNLNGGAKVAEVSHLPPTLSVQYHFNPNGGVRPYVGAGLNVTIFFSEDTKGPLAGSDLKLDPSFGPAAQVGLDIDLASNWLVNLDARWFDIDSDAELDGADLGTIEIDPYALGISVGRRF